MTEVHNYEELNDAINQVLLSGQLRPIIVLFDSPIGAIDDYIKEFISEDSSSLLIQKEPKLKDPNSFVVFNEDDQDLPLLPAGYNKMISKIVYCEYGPYRLSMTVLNYLESITRLYHIPTLYLAEKCLLSGSQDARLNNLVNNKFFCILYVQELSIY